MNRTNDYEPDGRSADELLRDWAAIMRALRVNGVIRTNNNPVGDIAEALVEKALGGTRGSFSQKGWDVRLAPSAAFPGGELVQVKSARLLPDTNRRNLSPIHDYPYDTVIIVLFDEDFRVSEGLRVPRSTVEELFSPRPRDGARIITLTKKLRAHPRVEAIDLVSSDL